MIKIFKKNTGNLKTLKIYFNNCESITFAKENI